MATKTLSITNDAYRTLKAHKRGNESFSDVINRWFPRHSLRELAGVLSEREAADLKKHVGELRHASRVRVDRVAAAIQKK
jgi:predicted CopG family antitoxin